MDQGHALADPLEDTKAGRTAYVREIHVKYGGWQMRTEFRGPTVNRDDLFFGIAITATAALVLMLAGLFS